MTETAVTPARKLSCRVEAVLVADGSTFATRPVERVEMDLEGIVLGEGRERHRGFSRGADVRVPWFPRGTPIRNSRQVSLVSREELDGVAADLGIPEVMAEWLGANIVVSGVPSFSFLPRGTRLMFPGKLALAVEDQNAPCRGPGRNIAAQHPGRPGLDLDFVKVASRRRGLVAWVERAGTVTTGETAELRIPEQWVW
jgi:hypothetical protein